MNRAQFIFPQSKMNYSLSSKIGQGSYGIVYKATNSDDHVFAIKKFHHLDDQGIPPDVVRELTLVQFLEKSHVVHLVEVIQTSPTKLFAVFDYYETDLYHLIRKGENLHLDYIRSILIDLFKTLRIAHSFGIVHRDIKPSNILMGKNATLCDFGCGRFSQKNMTPGLCTLGYRAPEILLGDVHYTEKVDIWAMGCLLLELVRGQPTFEEQTEIGHLFQIFQLLGTPKEGHLTTLPYFSSFPSWDNQLPSLLESHSSTLLDLVSHLLDLDPHTRYTADQALQHPFLNYLTPMKSIQPRVHPVIDFWSHHHITQFHQKILFDWMAEVASGFDFLPSTLEHAYLLHDQFLSQERDVGKKNYQLVGITCLILACKMSERTFPVLYRFSSVTDGACSIEQICKMERRILTVLKWYIPPPQ